MNNQIKGKNSLPLNPFLFAFYLKRIMCFGFWAFTSNLSYPYLPTFNSQTQNKTPHNQKNRYQKATKPFLILIIEETGILDCLSI